jgi:hypothetical protein
MIRLFILVLASTCPCEENIGRDDLTGLWQANSCIGSGLADVWFFMPDGAFLFRESSMNGAERLREFSGTFDVLGDTLRLVITSVILEEGGHIALYDGSASTGTDSILVDTETVERALEPSETMDLIIDFLGIETMDENPELPDDLMRLDLDGTTYWRFARDPEHCREMLGH